MTGVLRVLGVGNPILTDDGAGWEIVEEIRRLRPALDAVTVCAGAMGVFDYIVDCERVVLIDSIKSGTVAPGTVLRLSLDDLTPSLDQPTSHGMDIASACRIGEALGYRMPRQISIYAVEIADNTTIGEGCTPAVAACIPDVAKEIIAEEAL